MNFSGYNLKKINENVSFGMMDMLKIKGNLNFLALPFYFGQERESLKYYRFKCLVLNYDEVKKIGASSLILNSSLTSFFKMRVDNLYDLTSFNFSEIFLVNKFFHFLFSNNNGEGKYVSASSLLLKQGLFFITQDSVLRGDYFKIISRNTLQRNLILSDISFYVALFYNRFYKKSHSSDKEVDSFISTYIFDKQKVFSSVY